MGKTLDWLQFFNIMMDTRCSSHLWIDRFRFEEIGPLQMQITAHSAAPTTWSNIIGNVSIILLAISLLTLLQYSYQLIILLISLYQSILCPTQRWRQNNHLLHHKSSSHLPRTKHWTYHSILKVISTQSFQIPPLYHSMMKWSIDSSIFRFIHNCSHTKSRTSSNGISLVATVLLVIFGSKVCWRLMNVPDMLNGIYYGSLTSIPFFVECPSRDCCL